MGGEVIGPLTELDGEDFVHSTLDAPSEQEYGERK